MKKILLYGDSNTWGHNPVDMTKLPLTWGQVARDILKDCDITIDGECGRATIYGEGAKEGLKCYEERYLKVKHEFDLIAIMLGTNDVLNEVMFTAHKTAQSLGEYIDKTRAVYGSAAPEFLIISPIKIREAVLRHPIFSELYSQKSIDTALGFATAIEKMTKEKNVYFMDAAQYAAASDIDGVHMTVEEHKKLGVAAADAIKEIFKL